MSGCDVTGDAVRIRAANGLTGQNASVDEELADTGNLVRISRLLDRFRLTKAATRAVKTSFGECAGCSTWRQG